MKGYQTDRVHLGVCYYPEHWPETVWEDDYRRMKAAGIDTIRIMEFAWSILEPEEGQYDFSLFTRALDLAHQYGLKAIVGTPTATPPAWLTHRYPEVLNARRDGTVFTHGMRRHYNYNSRIYRAFSAEIVRKQAEAYGQHPAVVGWQIDNELNCEVDEFYSQADHLAFRRYVREKYGSIESLNQAWGTNFWSQQYTCFEEVGLPGPTISNSCNPHRELDMRRFIAHSTAAYATLHADIIHELSPGRYIMTNGLFSNIDYHDMPIDFMAFDNYPCFSQHDDGEGALRDRRACISLSRSRNIAEPFMVAEQQSGAGGWTISNWQGHDAPSPGHLRLWSWQSIAHGADCVSFFRWRTAPYGTEMYWHGILDQDNRDTRRLAEVTGLSQELAVVGQRIAGSRYSARAAILADFDNAWDGVHDQWHGPHTQASVRAWAQSFEHAHVPFDVVTLRKNDDDALLDSYDFLVYPHAAILTQDRADLLERAAQRGATVVFGCRTGYKDVYGQCPLGLVKPGPAARLCGTTVAEFTGIHGEAQPYEMRIGSCLVPISAFADLLTPEGGTCVGTYEGSWFSGQPGCVKNAVGKGTCIYYGSVFTEAAAHALLDMAGITAACDDVFTLPSDVSLAVRQKPGCTTAFVLNYANAPEEIIIKKPVTELLSGKTLSGSVRMEPYGVMLFDLA